MISAMNLPAGTSLVDSVPEIDDAVGDTRIED